MNNEIFKRSAYNPIITFADLPYRCSKVFNPGAALVNDDILLLLRVEDLEGKSHLTVARSKDGVTGWRFETKPLVQPEHGQPYEEYGCEDPRITYLPDIGKWVIAYTAYSPFGAGVGLATTSDFKSIQRYGLIFAPNNKDAAVFPRKIGDRYWMLHRPMAGDVQHIWLTESVDMIHWGKPWCVIQERGGPWWDGAKTGAATIPIETDDGWLILYHGVKEFPAGPMYRLGAALLDLEDPRRLVARLPYWILGPQEVYETSGQVANIVFPCGHIIKGDIMNLYYGAADSTVCLATCKVSDLLAALRKEWSV